MAKQVESANEWLGRMLATRGRGASSALADFLKVPPATISKMVRGEKGGQPQKIDATDLWRIEEFFGSNYTPQRSASVPVVGTVGADPSGKILYGAGDEPSEFVPPPPAGDAPCVAVRVDGHSMPGFAEHGALVYYEDVRNPPGEDLLGLYVVAGLDTGEVVIKRLLRGSRKGLYNLESIAAPLRQDVRIDWVAEIVAVIPAKRARTIIRNSSTQEASS